MEMKGNMGSNNRIICPHCGEVVAETCKFCPRCGADVRKVPRGKVCENCGSQVKEEDMFCPVCGVAVRRVSPVQTYRTVCSNCGAQVEEGVRFCQTCGTEVGAGAYTQKARPMKWFKFVIYVQLFLAALSGIGVGISYLTGTVYGDAASQVYFFYKSLKTLDVVFGVLGIIGAVLAIIVRQSLAHYKKSGPGMYYAFLVYNIVVNVLYFIGITALGLFDIIGKQIGFSTGGYIVTGGLLLVLNIVYFSKRMDLFVN